MLDPSGGSVMLCYVTANQYEAVLNHHLYPLMKHFYPDGSDLFQNDNASIHMARGVTEWFEV